MGRRAGVLLQRQWRDRLERFGRSGLSVAEFCRREGVSAASFYQWRKKLAGTIRPGQDATSAATFLPVQVAAARDLQAAGTARMHVAFPNGATLTLAADDPALIQLSIEAIAESRTAKGEA